MGMPLPQFRFDAQSYLAWEAEQTERHEFVDGEVYAMTGARDLHNRVALNMAAALKAALKGKPCRTFMSDMKLHVEAAHAYFYPDVFVTCDPRDRTAEADLMKRHPTLIVEVLSDSTQSYDRGRKFELYRSIPELREVWFVNPERRQVERFQRSADDAAVWLLRALGGRQVLAVESLGLDLPLDEVYDDVVPAD